MSLAFMVGAISFALVASPAHAVHDVDLFELDGNAVDGAADGDDWDTVVLGGGGASTGSVFVADSDSPTDTTYFTGGGSKDINDVPAWAHTANDQAPDKDEILNAYAAAYDDGGDLILYFGSDRFANNGDAQIGFWFFQEEIGLGPGGTFTGAHNIGDVLILSDFVNGGSISQVRVFEWVGSGGSEGALDEIIAGADCAGTPPGDDVCALVNQIPQPAPWAFTPKKGTSGTFPAGSFYEGGVDLSAIPEFAGVDCLSSFLAETRSSQSPSAQLKDFALGNFDLCSIDVVKTGDAIGKVGDAVDYTITITNDGGKTLYKDDISDSILGDITIDGADQANANVVSNTCGASLAPEDDCEIVLSYIVQEGDPDPLENTVTITYRTQSGINEGVAVSDSDGHSVDLFQPDVDLTKTVDPETSKVGDEVTYTFRVDNTSSSDSPDLLIDSFDDDVLGDLSGDATTAGCDTLAPAGFCEFTIAYTIQPGDPDPLVNTATVHYHPETFPNDITDSDSASVELFQPSVVITKGGDELSKVGDEVTYTFRIDNTSSSDSPDLLIDSISDDVLGDLSADATGAGCDTLAPAGFCEFTVNYTVQPGDADPLVNTVTVHYHPQGFENDITDDDDHSLNLFQPSVVASLSVDELSKVGDDITYSYRVDNTSSSDSPDLLIDSISDDIFGDLSADATGAGCDTLAPAGFCEFTKSYTIQSGDPDPLTNQLTVHYHPEEFGNDITDDSDLVSTNLFQPSVEVLKGGPATATVGQLITYTFTINNLSSSDSPELILDSVIDTILGDITAAATTGGCGTLAAPSGSCNFTVDYTVQASDPNPLVNTVTVHYHPDDFPNDITDDDDHSVTIEVEGEGCTPGFWQGGNGSTLWNAVNDADWTAAGGAGSNPFIHTTLFNDFFTDHSSLNGLTMLDIVGTGGGNSPARKAARDLVAAYLNVSFGLDIDGLTTTDLIDLWDDAVAAGNGALQDLHDYLAPLNDRDCTIG